MKLCKMRRLKKNAGDDQLARMEKEVERLGEIRDKNSSQVNDAKYWQDHSDMIGLRLKL